MVYNCLSQATEIRRSCEQRYFAKLIACCMFSSSTLSYFSEMASLFSCTSLQLYLPPGEEQLRFSSLFQACSLQRNITAHSLFFHSHAVRCQSCCRHWDRAGTSPGPITWLAFGAHTGQPRLASYNTHGGCVHVALSAPWNTHMQIHEHVNKGKAATKAQSYMLLLSCTYICIEWCACHTETHTQ